MRREGGREAMYVGCKHAVGDKSKNGRPTADVCQERAESVSLYSQYVWAYTGKCRTPLKNLLRVTSHNPSGSGLHISMIYVGR
jgi:hypothetical protein